MSPNAMAFIDGTAQVWAARAGLRPAPTARVDWHEARIRLGLAPQIATLAGGRVSCAKGRRLLLLFRSP